jgi:CRISPR-associated protein Cas5a/b/c
MSDASAEIASQPDAWRHAIRMAGSGLVGLPRPGERVAVIGCGTSYNAALAYARLREAAGQGETDAWPASEFPAGRPYDRVLAISRTGTTTEVLLALRAVPARVPTTAFTALAGTPLAAAARHAVPLDFADERSVVSTRFPTALLVLLRASLGEDVTGLPDLAAGAVRAPLPAPGFRQYTFLGTGWAAGIAAEAALKLREAAGAWSESYSAMEYRHGPISAADGRSLVWFLGTPPAGLVEDVHRTGAAVEAAGTDPLADLIRAQRLAVGLAESRGLDPDRPKHLTRSIILR